MMIKRMFRWALVVGGCYLCALPGSGCLPADRVHESFTAWVTEGSPNVSPPY